MPKEPLSLIVAGADRTEAATAWQRATRDAAAPLENATRRPVPGCSALHNPTAR